MLLTALAVLGADPFPTSDPWIARVVVVTGLLTGAIGAVFAGLRSIGIGHQVTQMQTDQADRHAENTAAIAKLTESHEAILARLDKLDPPAAAPDGR